MNFENVKFYNKDRNIIELREETKSYLKLIKRGNDNALIGIKDEELSNFFNKCNNEVIIEEYELNNSELLPLDRKEKVENLILVTIGKKETELDYIYNLATQINDFFDGEMIFTSIIDDNLKCDCKVLILRNK